MYPEHPRDLGIIYEVLKRCLRVDGTPFSSNHKRSLLLDLGL
jgi:hypothetical protein